MLDNNQFKFAYAYAEVEPYSKKEDTEEKDLFIPFFEITWKQFFRNPTKLVTNTVKDVKNYDYAEKAKNIYKDVTTYDYKKKIDNIIDDSVEVADTVGKFVKDTADTVGQQVKQGFIDAAEKLSGEHERKIADEEAEKAEREARKAQEAFELAEQEALTAKTEQEAVIKQTQKEQEEAFAAAKLKQQEGEAASLAARKSGVALSSHARAKSALTMQADSAADIDVAAAALTEPTETVGQPGVAVTDVKPATLPGGYVGTEEVEQDPTRLNI